jgi:hypothetical protein
MSYYPLSAVISYHHSRGGCAHHMNNILSGQRASVVFHSHISSIYLVAPEYLIVGKHPITKEAPDITEQQVWGIERRKMAAPVVHRDVLDIAAAACPLQRQAIAQISRKLRDSHGLSYGRQQLYALQRYGTVLWQVVRKTIS